MMNNLDINRYYGIFAVFEVLKNVSATTNKQIY